MVGSVGTGQLGVHSVVFGPENDRMNTQSTDNVRMNRRLPRSIRLCRMICRMSGDTAYDTVDGVVSQCDSMS